MMTSRRLESGSNAAGRIPTAAMIAALASLVGCTSPAEVDDCDGEACDGSSGVGTAVDTDTDTDTDTGGDAGDAATGGATTAGGDSDGDSDSADASSDGVEPPTGCGAAQGIGLGDVSVFQVIEVPVLEGCAAIAPADRVAPLVAGRVAVARATLVSVTDATPPLALRVDVSGADAESFVGECQTAEAGAHISVEIPASAMSADAELSGAIVECDEGGPTEDAALTFPEQGTVALAARDTGTMRIQLVPFEVGGFVPDTSPEVLDGFRDAIVAMYPVADVELTVGEVQPDQDGGQVNMNELMFRLIQLQEDLVFASGDFDPAVADIYFYGLVTGAATREEFCDSCPTGTSESGVGERAGSAMGAAFADELAESTLIHELGHMHGLLHSPCGEPNLQDDAFPHADGSTATEGWDFRTGTFIPADHNDLMGYCQPRWVSAYHYAKMVDWVDLANSWGNAESPASPSTHGQTRTHCSP